MEERKSLITKKGCRKQRVSFSPEVKLELLKLCVEHNPFDQSLKVEVWSTVIANIYQKFNLTTDKKTLMAVLKRMMAVYQKNQNQFKSGSEEIETEAKSLLEILVGFEESNTVDNPAESDDVFIENEILAEVKTSPEAGFSISKEKKIADAEREKLIESVPEPSHKRSRRSIPLEDEMILKKQAHDQEIEVKRLKLEEVKSEREYELEQRKLAMESEKLKVQAEESRRRDEIQATQLELQKKMYELLKSFVPKQ